MAGGKPAAKGCGTSSSVADSFGRIEVIQDNPSRRNRVTRSLHLSYDSLAMPHLRRADHEAATVPDSRQQNPQVGRSLSSHLHGYSSRGPHGVVRRLGTTA